MSTIPATTMLNVGTLTGFAHSTQSRCCYPRESWAACRRWWRCRAWVVEVGVDEKGLAIEQRHAFMQA